LAHPRRQVAWIWPALLLAGLAAIVICRVWSGWARRPMVASTDHTEGRVEGEAAALVAVGRRLRHLQVQLADTEHRLANLQTHIAAKRRQVRTLDDMLGVGRLTECPPFLRDKTTVRALQKIIREAEGPVQAEAGRRSRLSTAATVARERLRAKLSALRAEWAHAVAELKDQAATLRQQRRLQERGVQRLRRQIDERLEGRSRHPPSPHPSSRRGIRGPPAEANPR